MDVWAQIKIKKTVTFIVLLGILTAGLLIFNRYFYANGVALAAERQSLAATGTLEAKTVMASFKVPGKLASIVVDEGNKVEIGQELATLESQEINSDVIAARGAYDAATGQVQQAADAVPLTSRQVETTIAQTQAKVAQAEIGVSDAKATYDRAVKLFEGGAIAQKNLDDATNAFDLAKKKLQEAQSGLDQALSARLNVQIAESKYQSAQGVVQQASGAVLKAEAYLNNTHLLAPQAGYITQKYLQQGEMLNAGTPVFEISDIAHLYVNIYLGEDKIGRVQLNQGAEVTVDSFPGRIFKGKVVLIGNAGEFAVKKAVNEQYSHDLRSFKVKIDVPNQDLVLKSGMNARVKITEGAE